MQKAEAGVVEAQFYLAILYGTGEGVEQDSEKAFEWLLKAAKQGVADFCYENGEGVEQNYE
ncbi:MAG: SEL1-like repeat protein [Alphaproteobacteria bacterium]|nr:SEL1-like repeat protein [Alphaproteobacteria bacterium]